MTWHPFHNDVRVPRGQLVLLWCLVFAILGVLTAIECVAYSLAGVRYVPASSLSDVVACDVSVDSSGAFAAVVIRAHPDSHRDPVWKEVMLFDLQRGEAVPLGLRHLRPKYAALSPGGLMLALVCEDGRILLFPSPWTDDMGRMRPLANTGDLPVTRCEFSSDGNRVSAFQNATVVAAWDVSAPSDSDQHVQRSRVHPQATSRKPCMATSRTAATDQDDAWGGDVFRDDLVVGVRDRESGDVLWADRKAHYTPANASNAEYVAFPVCDGGSYHVRVRHRINGAVKCDLRCQGAYIVGMVLTPDGHLYVWDASGWMSAYDVHECHQLWSLSLTVWSATANLR
jgi:hypothetical protein